MSHDNDPISVTAYLRDLVRVFVGEAEAGCPRTPLRNEEQSKAIDDCFQLFLGRNPTKDELNRITPW